MCSTILSIGGWILFYLFILFYVRWVCLERVYFGGDDSEGSDLRSQSDEHPADRRLPERTALTLPLLYSLGRPA